MPILLRRESGSKFPPRYQILVSQLFPCLLVAWGISAGSRRADTVNKPEKTAVPKTALNFQKLRNKNHFYQIRNKHAGYKPKKIYKRYLQK